MVHHYSSPFLKNCHHSLQIVRNHHNSLKNLKLIWILSFAPLKAPQKMPKKMPKKLRTKIHQQNNLPCIQIYQILYFLFWIFEDNKILSWCKVFGNFDYNRLNCKFFKMKTSHSKDLNSFQFPTDFNLIPALQLTLQKLRSCDSISECKSTSCFCFIWERKNNQF